MSVIIYLALPIGILVGLGASVIGLTAWPLIVPLFFVFGGFSLHESLLASMCIDLILALFLSVFYKRQSDIDVDSTYGIKLGLILGAIAFIAALIAFPLLLQYSDLFKGGSGIINFILGALFIIQAIRTKKNDDPATMTTEIHSQSSLRWQNVTLSQKNWIVIIFCIIQGLVTGIIAISGAMNIVIVLIAIMGYHTLRAVGTAMISTTIMLGITVMTYLVLLNFVVTILPLILLYSLIAILSCIFGVRMAKQISERHLRFVIGIVVIAAAIFSYVQLFLLT
jgi:uncharacterized membrane protein YfcA